MSGTMAQVSAKFSPLPHFNESEKNAFVSLNMQLPKYWNSP